MKPAIIVTALLAVGCGATVKSSVAPGTNLAQFRTFGFAAPSSAQPVSVADQTIEDALRQSLLAKGYVEANNRPDFLVAHHVKLQQQTQYNGVGYYGYYGFGGVDAYTYTEGTLIVDFIDPGTNKAFWRGTAADVVNHPSSPNAGKIQAAVEKLINRYPASVASAARTNL